MTDMQLIRYRAIAPGRWKRYALTEDHTKIHGPTIWWQHTHDVRTKRVMLEDMHIRVLAGVYHAKVALDETLRYAGGAFGPVRK